MYLSSFRVFKALALPPSLLSLLYPAAVWFTSPPGHVSCAALLPVLRTAAPTAKGLSPTGGRLLPLSIAHRTLHTRLPHTRETSFQVWWFLLDAHLKRREGTLQPFGKRRCVAMIRWQFGGSASSGK